MEYGFLEHCLREDLNEHAQRAMAVLRPIKLTITNYPRGGKRAGGGGRTTPTTLPPGTRPVSFFQASVYLSREDFLETPVPKYKRLYPTGPECRLKGAYLIKCTGCVKDEAGNVVEVLAEYDPESRGGNPADGRKVKGATIHWVDAATAVDAEVRLYDNLFTDAEPDAGDKELPGLPQPQLSGGAPPRQGGGRPGRCGGPRLLPVPAPGLLLRGQQGQRPRPSGVQTAR